ncbi:hypothetical protein OUZ56_013767 [Daphnia magna]|uniref:Uncharacterized protein n=1 Tax=Daphnia magna TaxID=35525 RepID=A0ABQ9Z6V4_9CRUS|nr:hypothetical protein OUZ56_013767 [Daphnia magna]
MSEKTSQDSMFLPPSPCPSPCPSSCPSPCPSSSRLSPCPSSFPPPSLCYARHPALSRDRPAFSSPVAPSSPRGRPITASLLGSGSAVLPNGLYAMGGTVAQAVWLKVDRRGNAPVGTSPLSMWWWLPGELGWGSNP